MAVLEYDLVFVGGGLATLLLLGELGSALPDKVAMVDPHLPQDLPTVHWSYWSSGETPYDRFATGIWRRARVADGTGATRSSRTLNLCARRGCSTAPPACPHVPPRQGPQAVESGTGVRLEADSSVFDPATATLFDPLDESSFAYLLPLSPTEALLESASFGPVGMKEDQAPLLRYLQTSYPGAGFTVSHAESGSIPLGFAPRRTAGPRHVLLGTKRGLIKPSAGYGIVRIAEASKRPPVAR